MTNTDIESTCSGKVIHSQDVFNAVRQDAANDHLFDVYATEWVSNVCDEHVHQIHEEDGLETMSKMIGDREVVSEKRIEAIRDGKRAVRIEKRVRK